GDRRDLPRRAGDRRPRLMALQPAPGLYFEIVRPPADPAQVRSDIAGFAGRTRRGPVGEVVRVEGWREDERLFGGLAAASISGYAVRSYFENGGQVAYVVRVAGPNVPTVKTAWPPAAGPALPGHRVTTPSGTVLSQAFIAGGQAVQEFEVEASSPGAWAD